MKPILLDLFCGAGGAAMGYHRAGWDVLGVDINPQPRYPFPFVQGDALEMARTLGGAVHAIHASPPCQAYSTLTKLHGLERVASHPDLLAPTRELLEELGKPYVIENVVGAPLVNPVLLCGSMFALGAGDMYLQRHRLFESPAVSLWPPATCAHGKFAVGVYGKPGGMSKRDHGRYGRRKPDGGGPLRKFGNAADWREAMGIEWMSTTELAQAIPPAYTESIGRQLAAALGYGS